MNNLRLISIDFPELLGEPTYTSILVEISAIPKLFIPCSRLTEFSVETHNELRAVVSRALAEVHSAGQSVREVGT